MKNLKKTIFSTLLLVILISTTVFATTTNSDKITLQVVEEPICTINIKDIATFEKRLLTYDLAKKELTIKLSIKNNAQAAEAKPTEVVLAIDNSLSMDNEVSTGVTRLQTVTNSAKDLATKLLENENTKIGVVSFSTGDVSTEGSLSDAFLRTSLSDNSSTILSAIDNIPTDTTKKGPRTNIDAGLQVASSCFSKEDTNKYLVLLTDGVPNAAVGGPIETFSAEVATKTKATLTNLSTSGINIISAMIGLPGDVIEPSTQLTYKALSEEIFGTSQEPTVGKFYYIPDEDIGDTISKSIFSDIIDNSLTTLTNIDIYDYFPKEIVDNFDFEYTTSPTLGTVSPKIDTATNTIVWHIDKLEPQASGYLTYKLTVKKEVDSSAINIVLNTNKKIEITADEIKTDDGEKDILSSTVSPKVKLVQDTTVSDKVIPQTGISNTLYIVIGLVTIICLFAGIKFILINKDLK